MGAPPPPFLPAEQFGRPIVVLVIAWAGDIAAGREAIAPLRAAATPLAESSAPAPYVALQSMLDGGAPHGRHYYWKSHRLPDAHRRGHRRVLERTAAMTSPFAQISGWAVGGAVSRVAPDATAVGEREVGFDVSLAAAGTRAIPTASATRTGRAPGGGRCAPQSTGVYANFISDEGAAGVRAAYGDRLRG